MIAPMDAAELTAWMHEQGFTVARLASELGVGERTVYSWRSGRTEIPPYLERALNGPPLAQPPARRSSPRARRA